jgi:hypothetical protein
MAAAQPPGAVLAQLPVEIWGTFSLPRWTGGQLHSSYEPELVAATSEGRATQSLFLEPVIGTGFEAGVNVFPVSRAGVQVQVTYARGEWAGESSAYDLELRYVSRPPPGTEPQTGEYRRSMTWPRPEGHLTRWSVGGGPVVRWRRGRVGGIVGAGALVRRRSGAAESLGFTVFRLGGHSTLFADEFRVRVGLGPSTSAGAYVGTAFDVGVSERVAATVGVRASVWGASDMTVRVAGLTDRGAAFAAPALVDIDRRMAIDPIRLPPREVAVSVGLKVQCGRRAAP